MKLHVLTIPLLGTNGRDPLEDLQAHWEISRYDHYLVDLPEGPAITIVAALRERELGHETRLGPETRRGVQRTSREQLVASLDPVARDRFEQLRVWRKATARDEGLPVYALATNAQLAEMASLSSPSKSKLGDISGFGHKKVERYGDDIVSLLSRGQQRQGEEPGTPGNGEETNPTESNEKEGTDA